ncbi:pitrilysin family protein [Pseudomonas sp. F1_0610]|uniref:M16 family metallopeptidase n=1 Tax=Pseudomonas sp. F1_0610 TaxID=3114284 RepID=UPI0039C2DCFE
MSLTRTLTVSLLSLAILSGCLPQNTSSSLSAHNPKIKSLSLLDQPARAPRALDIQEWRTSTGTKVLFMHASELPMVDIQLTFAAGSSRDGQLFGLANLTSSMLDEGTGKKLVGDIAAEFDNLGAQFDAGAYRDMAVMSLRSLSNPNNLDPALKLFTEVVTQPSFPQPALDRLKNQLLASFEMQKQNPGAIASLALYDTFYGDHPYAHPSSGTASTIKQIKRQDLITFHRNAYNSSNLNIAIVGDISRAKAEQMAEKISQAMPKGQAFPAVASPTARKIENVHITYPSTQTHLTLASLGIKRGDPDYPALFVANQIFGGGGFGSRLMEEVREKRGLTYGVYSNFSTLQERGLFTISLQTRAELSDATLVFIKELLADFINNGPTAKELADTKREIAGSYPLSAASNSAIVGQLGAYGFYDMPLDWQQQFMQQINDLTLEQVKHAMQKHVQLDNMSVVSVGPKVAQKPLPPAVDRKETTAQGYSHQ